MATDVLTPTAMIAELRDTAAMLRSAQTRVFVLAAEWADAHPDDRASGACIHGCPTTGLPGEDFGGGCANGCVGDPDGFDDPFIPRCAGTPRPRSAPRSAAPPMPRRS